MSAKVNSPVASKSSTSPVKPKGSRSPRKNPTPRKRILPIIPTEYEEPEIVNNLASPKCDQPSLEVEKKSEPKKKSTSRKRTQPVKLSAPAEKTSEKVKTPNPRKRALPRTQPEGDKKLVKSPTLRKRVRPKRSEKTEPQKRSEKTEPQKTPMPRKRVRQSTTPETTPEDAKKCDSQKTPKGRKKRAKKSSAVAEDSSSPESSPDQTPVFAQLTEQLRDLNQMSGSLSTRLHNRITPRKRSKHTPLKHTPLTLRTPRRTPSRSPRTPQSTSSPRTPRRACVKRILYTSPEGKSPVQSPASVMSPASASTPMGSPWPELDTPTKQALLIHGSSKGANYSPQLGDDLHISPEKSSPEKSVNRDAMNSSVDSSHLVIEEEDEGIQPLSIISSDEDLDRIDEQLESKSKSQSIQLTATNVRSILREVITNEAVLDMVRNTIENENCLGEQLRTAIFEPKMTRSRVKEVLKTDATSQLLPWSFSPMKGLPGLHTAMAEQPPRFLDIAFSDDEEDEYRPSPEDLEHVSDDESCVSSLASDLDSPLPQTLTPVTAIPDSTPGHMTPGGSEMGPPASLPLKARRNINPELNDASNQSIEDSLTIALRTRSKLPLTDTPLEVIESSFVAPDITPDVYDTACDDTEWLSFLTGLMKTESHEDEPIEDPEYEYRMEEAEEEEEDEEECRDDKAVRVTKKELTSLMNELFEAYGGADLLISDTEECPKDHEGQKAEEDEGSPSEDGETRKGFLAPPIDLDPQFAQVMVNTIKRIQNPESKIQKKSDVPYMSPDELLQVEDQMRKYVQLLAQSYVQAAGRPYSQDVEEEIADPDIVLAREQTKKYLLELRALAEERNLRNGSACRRSFFQPPNLDSAIAITHRMYLDDKTEKASQTRVALRKSMSASLFDMCGLNYQQLEVFVSNKTFIFPQMLPDCSLLPSSIIYSRGRATFLEAEDALLAMGLDQFGWTSCKYDLIHKYLMPCRARTSLRYHVRNVSISTTKRKGNPINYFEEHKKLPSFPRYMHVEPEDQIVAPVDRSEMLMPQWWEGYKDVFQDYAATILGRPIWKPQWVTKELEDLEKKVKTKVETSEKSLVPIATSGISSWCGFQSSSPLLASNFPQVKFVPKPEACEPVAPLQMSEDAQTMSFVNHIIQGAPLEPEITPPSPRPVAAQQTGDGVFVLTSTQLQALGINVISLAPNTPPVVTVVKALPRTVPSPVSSEPTVTALASPVVHTEPFVVEHPEPLTPAVLAEPFNPVPSTPDVMCNESPMPASPIIEGRDLISHAFHEAMIFTSPVKPAIEIMSEMAQHLSPTKTPDKKMKTPESSPKLQTPPSTPSKIQTIAPKPGTPSPNPVVPKVFPKNRSRRRRILQRKARRIAPKGLVIRTYNSPVKKAAKRAVMRSLAIKSPTKCFRTLLPTIRASKAASEGEEEDEGLAQLMEASTTIKTLPPKVDQKRVSRAKIEKESIADMLQPNLLASDPLHDERDTHYAQAYLQVVRKALTLDPDRYYRFLETLYEFGRSASKSPVELYTMLSAVLDGHPELVEQFVGFLLPHQAQECGRLTQCMRMQQVRCFIRKLGVGLKKQPQLLQRVIRECSKNKTPEELKDVVKGMLRGHDHLLEEFLSIYDDEHPPESAASDFEEVNLGDSEEEVDDFENVEILGSDDEVAHEGTKECECSCHNSTDAFYSKRRRHCQTCGLKFIKGSLYMQSTVLTPMTVVYPHQEDEKDEQKSGPSPPPLHTEGSTPGNTSVTGPTDFSTALRQVISDPSSDGPSEGITDSSEVEEEDEEEEEEEEREDKEKLVFRFNLSPVNTDDSQSASESSVKPIGELSENSRTNDSMLSAEDSSRDDDSFLDIEWTEEDDRVILETCKAKGASSATFASVADTLGSKTISQIRQRLSKLLQMFAEMDSETDEGET